MDGPDLKETSSGGMVTRQFLPTDGMSCGVGFSAKAEVARSQLRTNL